MRDLRPTTREEIAALHCTVDDLRRILRDAPFFRELGAGEVDDVAAMFHQAHYAPGEVIQRAGDSAIRLSIVAAGMLKVARPTLDGQDVLLDVLGSGDIFGSLDLLGDTVYADDATAQTHCCVLHASSQVFRAMLDRYPSVAVAALAFIAGRLSEAHETIERLSASPVDQRVAATLLKLAGRAGRPDNGALVIDMPITRQDLADMTGATVETVSRVISELRRSGVIESGRKWIAITDRDALAALASSRSRN